MKKCECREVQWQRKISQSDGTILLVGIQIPCGQCQGELRMVFRRVPKAAVKQRVGELVPELEFKNYKARVNLMDPEDLRIQIAAGVQQFSDLSDTELDYAAEDIVHEMAQLFKTEWSDERY